jgi:uncharacterized membrane protein YhaH (DUF805 family)
MDPKVLKAVYLSSEGRIGRLAYFGFGLAAAIVYVIIAGILTTLLGMVGLIVAFVVYLPMLYIQYNLAAKRFHDLNKPGQYALYVMGVAFVTAILTRIESLQMVGTLVDILLLVVGLYLLFMPGTAGANAYGGAPNALPGTQ